MIVNHEKLRARRADAEFGGGLGIYDVGKPAEPEAHHASGSPAARACTATISTAATPTSRRPPTGYVGNIVMILDLIDPAHPTEVGRWWIPGQWTAGGEEYPWDNYDDAALPSPAAPRRPALCQLLAPRALHPRHLRHGAAEAGVAQVNTSPAFPHPTHTCLPMPQPLKGRGHHGRRGRGRGEALAFGAGLHLDLRHHRSRRKPTADRDVPGRGPRPRRRAAAADDRLPPAVGAVQGTIIPFAWFAQGLRLVDIADPFAPEGGGALRARRRSGGDARPRPTTSPSTTAASSIWSTGSRRRHHRNQCVLGGMPSDAEIRQPLRDRQEEPEPAVPPGGARGRLHLRLGPGVRRTPGQHAGRAPSRKRRAGTIEAIQRLHRGRGRDARRRRPGHDLSRGHARLRPLQQAFFKSISTMPCSPARRSRRAP